MAVTAQRQSKRARKEPERLIDQPVPKVKPRVRKTGTKPQRAAITETKTQRAANTSAGVKKTTGKKHQNKKQPQPQQEEEGDEEGDEEGENEEPSNVTKLTFDDLTEQSQFFMQARHREDLGLGDLNDNSAPINAIFTRDHFLSGTVVYDALKPSLHLASKFLESDQLRTMIAVMWRARDQRIRIVPTERDNQRRRLWHYPSEVLDPIKRDYKAEGTEDIDAVMKEFSNCINFDESKNATDANARDGTHTWACKDPDRALTGSKNTKHLEGVPSTVYYDTEMYMDLLRATKTPVDNSDIANLLTLRFQFAVTLIHEVMHALQNAIYTELDTDPFHGEDLLAETGFEAECTLLNGQFDVVYSQRSPRGISDVRATLDADGAKSELVGIPLIWNWPCRNTMVLYLDKNLGICARRGWRGKMPAKDIGWRVKPEDIERYFTQEWWDDADERAGEEGLFLPQNVGHAFEVGDRKGFPLPTALSDGEEQESGGQYVPPDHKYEPTGQDIVPREE